MDNSRITIKVGSGSHNFLDKKYNNYLKQSVNLNEKTVERWITYDVIINEIIQLGKINYFDEFKYRLTGGEDPNQILIEIINKDNETRTYLWHHLKRLKFFINDDLMRRFYE